MNKTGQKNIGSMPIFENKNTQTNFLNEQIKLWREIRQGNNTWKDMNELRKSYKFPDVNIDSLRRSFSAMEMYDDEGWIRPLDLDEGVNEDFVPPKKDVIETNYTTGVISSDKFIALFPKEINNAECLLKAHGFNSDEFELISAKNSKWESLAREGEELKTKTLYSSKISVKLKSSKLSDIEKVLELFKTYESPYFNRAIHKEKIKSRETLVLPLYDLHWGRLPDNENFTHYDIEEEKQKILDHVDKYIKKFNNRNFDKIYLVVGQDFLNSSFTGYTSSQSHLQSNAIDFRTMFRTGSELLISIIDMFAMICNNLEVIGSLGNHDVAEEVALFQLLKAYYRTVDGIKIDDKTTPRKYIKIGNSCVGVGHLDKERDRIYGLMQVEAKDIWANTNIHMFIAGHLHHFEVTSKQGVELYRVPSICPPDRWTVEQGYTMNEPKTMCFIFDEVQGLTETHFMYLNN